MLSFMDRQHPCRAAVAGLPRQIGQIIGGTVRHRIPIDQLNREILDRRDSPLPEVINFQPATPTSSYVRQVFATEFQSLHGNTFRGKGPKSVINEYVALIRSVGRLAAPNTQAEA